MNNMNSMINDSCINDTSSGGQKYTACPQGLNISCTNGTLSGWTKISYMAIGLKHTCTTCHHGTEYTCRKVIDYVTIMFEYLNPYRRRCGTSSAVCGAVYNAHAFGKFPCTLCTIDTVVHNYQKWTLLWLK